MMDRWKALASVGAGAEGPVLVRSNLGMAPAACVAGLATSAARTTALPGFAT
jgi:hypothetical protein